MIENYKNDTQRPISGAPLPPLRMALYFSATLFGIQVKKKPWPLYTYSNPELGG